MRCVECGAVLRILDGSMTSSYRVFVYVVNVCLGAAGVVLCLCFTELTWLGLAARGTAYRLRRNQQWILYSFHLRSTCPVIAICTPS